MNLCHIVATDELGVIGRQGQMPWHLSDDLRRFKALNVLNTIHTAGCLPLNRWKTRFIVLIQCHIAALHRTVTANICAQYMATANRRETLEYVV